MSVGGTPLSALRVIRSSNLEDYRALLQVLAHACHKRRAAVDVVGDAVTGGVVSLFYDDKRRCKGTVLMPSLKSVVLIASLAAEGFFVPSLSSSVDGGGKQYTMLAEGDGRDLFTLLVILFPDCFVDDTTEPAEAVPTDDREDTGRTVDCVTVFSPSLGDFITSVPTPSGLGTQSDGTPSSSRASLRNPRYGDATGADLLNLHESRQRVAMTFLSALNDSLHSVQLRLLKRQKGTPVAPPSPLTMSPSESTAEGATLRSVTVLLLKAKMLLMCCVCATEMAYAALPTSSTENGVDAKTLATCTAFGDSVSDTTAVNERCPCPKSQLEAIARESFWKPIEDWTWETLDHCVSWYDNQFEHLLRNFESRPLRVLQEASLSMLFDTLKEKAVIGGRQITHAPELLLYRARDGECGVHLSMSHLFCRPRLPPIPLQPGELRLLMPAGANYAHDCLFDAEPSPVISFLQQCTVKRLSTLQTGEMHVLFHEPWASCSPQLQQIIGHFICDARNMDAMLEKNPILLSKLLMWGFGLSSFHSTVGGGEIRMKLGSSLAASVSSKAAGSEATGRNLSTPYCGESDQPFMNVLIRALDRLPYHVSVGQLVRELVVHNVLQREIFVRWVHRCGTAFMEMPSTSCKTFLLLVDFALAHRNWVLDGDTTDIVDALHHL